MKITEIKNEEMKNAVVVVLLSTSVTVSSRLSDSELSTGAQFNH